MRLFFFILEFKPYPCIMQKIFNALFLVSLFLSGSILKGESINAMALKNGCRIVKSPSTFFTSSVNTPIIEDWTWQGLVDESSSVGWCSGATSKVPYTFVFELSEAYLIDKLVFNNFCQTKYAGVCSKDINVEYSVTSPVSGFISIDTFTLQPYSSLNLNIKRVKARWIRLTILSNYGNSQWTELMEFEAWGDFAKPEIEQQSLTGFWKNLTDWVSISRTSKGNLYGCYNWANGQLFITSAKRRVYRFHWKHKDDEQKGWGVFVLNEEGTRINGIWGLDNDSSHYGNWGFSKSTVAPVSCSNEKEADLQLTPQPKTLGNRKDTSVTVLIELKDADTKVYLSGTVELHSTKSHISIPSYDGYYTADLPLAPFIVKTNVADYFPVTDTIKITEDFSRGYVNRVVYLSKLKVGNNIILKNILFNKGSSELLPNSNAELEALYVTLNKYPDMEIELSGHTDNQGDEDKNVLLSEQRVKSVKDYLVSKGIAASRIDGVGYGGKYPITSNATEQSRKLNRRVELKIIRM